MKVEHRRTAERAVIVVVLAFAATLSGCVGPSSSPTLTPTVAADPTSTPTPSPEPDPLGTVVSLVVRPMELELRAEGGDVIVALDYMSSPSDAITLLSDLFDAPPVDEPYGGTNHTPPGVFHKWDDFVIDERFYDEDRRDGSSLDYVWPRFAVYFDGPTAHGFELSSEQGFHATDAWSTLAGDPVVDAQLWTCVGTAIDTADFTRPDGRPETATVVATSSEDEATVKWLGAPVMVADGCA